MSAAATSDDGYSSDSSSASCESLADAVYAVEKENGREYASYYSAQYHVPVDRREQEREERIHQLLKKRCHGKLHYAPIGHPNRVLDIGTGTGRWAIESESSQCLSVIWQDSSPPPSILGKGGVF